MAIHDFHTVALIFAIAAFGGILGLDRTAFGQFMISQPLAAGPITGWLLGDIGAGSVIGGALELVWVLDMPVGTFVPADATMAAVAATAIAVMGSHGRATPDLIGFCIVLTALIAPVTTAVDDAVRKHNSELAVKAITGPERDPARTLARAHLSGLVVFFLKSFVLYLIVVPLGLAAVELYASWPARVHQGMALFVKLLPLLGAAIVIRKLSISVLDRFLVQGFAAAAVLTLVLRSHPAVVVVLMIAAAFAVVRLNDRPQ